MSTSIELSSTEESAESNWFSVHEMRPGVWMINEPGHVACWLVVGRDRACLVDAGLGVAPIRPVVEAITKLPIVVVNTHYHFDHVGGNAEFETVRAHPGAAESPRADLDLLAQQYSDFSLARQNRSSAYRSLDNYFGLLNPDTDPRPLLPDFVQRMALAAKRPIVAEPLAEGHEIDLGGRRLTALYTPGHSPDSTCFIDDLDGILFTGDTFNLGQVYCHFADSNLTELQESAERLSNLRTNVNYVVAHHNPRLIGETLLLRDYHDALRRLGSGDGHVTIDILGQGCVFVADGLFSFTLPAPGVEAVV